MLQAVLGGRQSLNASVLSHTLLMIVVQTENVSNYHCLMCVWLGPLLVVLSCCIWVLSCLSPLPVRYQLNSCKVTQHPSGSSSVRGQVPVGANEYFLELAECKPLQNNCQQPMFCNILLCCLNQCIRDITYHVGDCTHGHLY